ncbi:MAG: ABC transporter permease, partial [Oscillospiraceae bacterium]|nr:ABC transporter permease [Oscillospiraceae bacterium]
MSLNGENIKHSGRIGQVGIYLGKMFRMFVFQSDWKVLPMAAIIAGLVSMVVGRNLYYSMEGTAIGSFAITCVCIWNGCFNSIQVICRERAIIKREHRSGLHISSYVAAHMIYQACLCLGQTIITVIVLHFTMSRFSSGSIPETGFITGNGIADLAVTIFLITYSSNIISLFISAIVRNTTTAMTMVPFLLIFQLIFSGGFFELSEKIMPVSYFTVSRWGMTALCAEGNYNDLPMVSMLNALSNMQEFEMDADMKEAAIEAISEEYNVPKEVAAVYSQNIPDNSKPIKPIVYRIYGVNTKGEQIGEDHSREFMLECAKNNQNMRYASTKKNILDCWLAMAAFVAVFGILSV